MSDLRIVQTFPRRDGEEVRATLGQFRGRLYGSVRLYARTETGAWAPTRKGITFGIDEIDALESAVRAIRAAADAEMETAAVCDDGVEAWGA